MFGLAILLFFFPGRGLNEVLACGSGIRVKLMY